MPRKSNKKAANGSGSIGKKTVIQNGKEYVYWAARCTVGYDPGTGKQRQRTITGKSQAEVARKLRELTAEIDRGSYLAPCKLTAGEWLTIWLDEYTGDVKSSTAYLYRRNLEQYVIPNVGAVKLEKLSPLEIQRLYNKLLRPDSSDIKPLSAKTVRNVHGVFHKALQQAVQLGYTRSNPTDRCKPPRAERPDIHPLDEAQIVEFLKAIDGHPHELLYKIALFTGLREGEILGLCWDCVDLDQGTLTVRRQLRREQKKGGQYYFSPPKNNKVRVIVLAASVIHLLRLQKLKQEQLQALAGDAWEDKNLVFSNQLGGYLSYRTVYDCFKRIMAKIDAPSVRFHDLRHSYAVAAIRAGDDIKTVQENLGHATPAFTLEVYGHVTSQMRKASSERMEQFIQQVSGF